MTRQSWTALVAAVLFVLSAVGVVVLPVPFVTWSPGAATDALGSHQGTPLITVDGITTYPTTGQLDLTTVLQTRADGRLTLPEALWAYAAPHRDVLPRDAVFAPDQSAADAEAQEVRQMQTAQSDAVVAALRAAGQPVRELPVVSSVTVKGAADGHLEPGDLVTAVDGRTTRTLAAVQQAIRSRPVGSTLVFSVLRAKKAVKVTVVSRASSADPSVPLVGITVGTGYRYKPDISYDLGEEIGGPSAGLVFGLAIYDRITPGALLDGRHVAGTGTIDPDGTVGAIGGIQEKIAGAEKAGATVFLVPAPNCDDLAGLPTDLDLIKVDTLAHAVTALEDLDAGRTGQLPRC